MALLNISIKVYNLRQQMMVVLVGVQGPRDFIFEL